MGVAEDRLFKNQPALALGFRKSFSREQLGSDIRVAGIDLVASKTFGKTSLHVGGVFWDASMTDIASDAQLLLHDTGAKRQIPTLWRYRGRAHQKRPTTRRPVLGASLLPF